MPRGFMDDLEGEVIGEEVHEGGLWEDIFAADPDCEDALLTNIGEQLQHTTNSLISPEIIRDYTA